MNKFKMRVNKRLTDELARIKSFSSDFYKGEQEGINFALYAINSIDEPEKPTLTKEEAEWLEKLKESKRYLNKYDLLYFISRQGFGYAFSFKTHGEEIVLEDDDNDYRNDEKVKERLVNAVLYGYEAQKEKLYLASFRDTDQYLGWNEKLGEWFMSCSPFTSGVEQTQETWEGVGIWNNPAFEINEVEE